jgi:uncharacterized membrane protein
MANLPQKIRRKKAPTTVPSYNATMKNDPHSIRQPRVERSRVLRVLFLIFGLFVIGLWLVNTPSGLLGKADAVGYAVCHRIDLRSFHLGERQVPLCVRCSGMYLGALAALGYLGLRGRLKNRGYPRWPILMVFGAFALAWAIDGLNSYLHLFPEPMGVYAPSHPLRLITGTLMGVIIISMLVPTFNQSVRSGQVDQRILRSIPELLLLSGIALGVTGLQLIGNPIILYPLAILSAVSVMVILTMVYAMAIGLISGFERTSKSKNHVLLLLAGGLILAVVQIALIDLGRYWLTGTWEGFHF